MPVGEPEKLDAEKVGSIDKGKKVTFASDVKSASGASTPSATPVPETKKAEGDAKKDEVNKLDGVIGRLEIYQSGAVKMRLENGILLDVSE